MNSSNQLTYLLFEIANVHGGDEKHLERLIAEYSKVEYPKKGMKFQIFSPDTIALPDFPWYSVYQELYFEPNFWAKIIQQTSSLGDVWIDIFDLYSIEVISVNLNKICGIKLQASILLNDEVYTGLSKLVLNDKKIIINISGYELCQIEKTVEKFSSLSSNLILQIGFQNYPTEIADTALKKIAILKSSFPELKICMADHAEGGSEFAISVPVYASLLGCRYVEKHFCVTREGSKYDSYSSLEPNEIRRVCQALLEANASTGGSFISQRESEYLEKSIQVPVLKRDVRSGSLVSSSDIIFRRTGQKGLSAPEIHKKQIQKMILKNDKTEFQTIEEGDFIQAKLAVIVAGRLKSSRLPKKALLPISGVPSVERCLNQCLDVKGVDRVILATSNVESDNELEAFTCGNMVSVWRGHPDDVISRYLGACKKFGIDVVVRVTADCPLVMPDIIEYLIDQHFITGADYTAAKDFSVGTSAEIINVSALQKVSDYFGTPEYAEYMTWYFQNNPEHFKLNIVELPANMIRNYRMTLDYQEDLDMFNQLFSYLDPSKKAYRLDEVFKILDSNQKIYEMNLSLPLVYRTDAKLIATLNEKTKIS